MAVIVVSTKNFLPNVLMKKEENSIYLTYRAQKSK